MIQKQCCNKRKKESPFEELSPFFEAGCKGKGRVNYKPNFFASFLQKKLKSLTGKAYS
jgi:hypothetical protein